MNRFLVFIIFLILSPLTNLAYAEANEDYVITLKDQKFSPAELIIPANKKVKVTVKNLNKAAAEFESHALNREKIIAANGTAYIFIGPLKPGKYEYFDEFHSDLSRGTIVVK